MATGTFLSRDTYGGAMDNILSQNRYTYVGNNPVNYADPDGHKALGSTIKNTFSAIADAARNGARNAQNQTGRAAEMATAKAGDGAAAVSMAANRITKNEVNGVNRGTTKGGAAVQSAEEKITSGSQSSQGNQTRELNIRSDGDDELMKMGMDLFATYLAGKIDASPAGPWIGSVASAIEQLECAAYNYCKNEVQEFLATRDVGRIVTGAGLILTGITKMTGGMLLGLAGAGTSYTGIGFAGMIAGAITSMAGSSDVVQGFNEMRLGWNNDRTTRTRNLVRDTLYGGNDTIYHLSTGLAAMAGSALRPYVMPKKNPALAGGEQKDIAKKAAMGEKGGSQTVNGFDTTVNAGKQGKHIVGNNNFIEGRSVFNGTVDDAQRLVDNFAGTGEWIGTNKERVNFGEVIGQYVNPTTNEAVDTTVGIIHYSKTGTHIVPAQPI